MGRRCHRSAVIAGWVTVSVVFSGAAVAQPLFPTAAIHHPTPLETVDSIATDVVDMAYDAVDVAWESHQLLSGNDCDGYGSSSFYGFGALSLFGGHDRPYDFATDTMGLPDGSPVDVGGWIQFGVHNRSTGLFNRHPNRFQNHQSWLFVEKIADGSRGIDFGYRADMMYGVDAADTQAFGNNPGEWDFMNGYDHGRYGWAIPQLYLDVAYGDLTVRLGHFYTLLGYEVVTAPDNFFYSHSFTMYNSEAFTHTGALGIYTIDKDITLYGGWTAGWDTGFDQFRGGSSFLGGADVQLTDRTSLAFITTFGDFGDIGTGYSHSLVLDMQLTDYLNYVFQSDVLHTSWPIDTFGINQYLFYDLSKWLVAGVRYEWWKGNGVSYNGITGGVNIRLSGNFVLRPEVRYQWSPAANDSSGIFNRRNPAGLPVDDGIIFGIDAILTF